MKHLFVAVIAFVGFAAAAQSPVTNALEKEYDGMSAFFYHNTLRMINQSEDPAFDDLIRDVEKMKFVMIRKDVKAPDYRKLIGDYRAESFEEAMTSRHQGKNFDVFIKAEDNRTTGMLVLVNDETSLMVLDIVGSISLDKVTRLYSTLNESSEIGERIRAFSRAVQGPQEKKSGQ